MNISITDQIDLSKVLREINSPELWTFAAQDCYRLMSPLTPHRTGQLEQNVTIKPGIIIYNSPYSVYVYNGDNMNFRKDYNPKAGAHWDKRFVQEKTEYEKMIQDIQNYINQKL